MVRKSRSSGVMPPLSSLTSAMKLRASAGEISAIVRGSLEARTAEGPL